MQVTFLEGLGGFYSCHVLGATYNKLISDHPLGLELPMRMDMGSIVGSLYLCWLISVDYNFCKDLTAPDMIKFGIESKFSSPLTSTDGFKVAIVDALHQMASVCSVEVVQTYNLTYHL